MGDSAAARAGWHVSSRRSPEYAAVLVIASEAFPLDGRVWKYIDANSQEVDFDLMLGDVTFSPKERLLLEIAASLWSSTTHSTMLGVVADRLGEDGLAGVLRALAASRDARPRPNANRTPQQQY
jgi:hypothetical protein